MPSKFYFTRNGQELDHPANGLDQTGTGAYIGHIGSVPCRAQVYVSKGFGQNLESFQITSEDLGGPVMVKAWTAPHAGNGYRSHVEEFALCTPEDIKAQGGRLTENASEVVVKDGRGVEFCGWSPGSELVA